jgi:short-subunit dehydrogenase
MSKAILITGCSTGIGRATAEHLIKSGYKVYATARKPESITDLQEKGAITLSLDVTNNQSITNALNQISENGDTLYGLINNAGFGQMGPIEDVTEEKYRQQIETNVFGLAAMIRAALPLMRSNNQGIIINVSSIAGKVSIPLSGWYCASKFAVEALSDALRLEVRQFGIKVVVIEPGPIRTNFGEIAYGSANNVPETSPYKPMMNKLTQWSKQTLNDFVAGTSDDVAKVILKAITLRNPRPRYRITGIAKMLYLLRRITSDRMLDFMFRKQMGIK